MEETLEQAAEKFRSNNHGTMQGGNNTKILNAFKNGAKWQAERMYSEEDMLKFAQKYSVNTLDKSHIEKFKRNNYETKRRNALFRCNG